MGDTSSLVLGLFFQSKAPTVGFSLFFSLFFLGFPDFSPCVANTNQLFFFSSESDRPKDGTPTMFETLGGFDDQELVTWKRVNAKSSLERLDSLTTELGKLFLSFQFATYVPPSFADPYSPNTTDFAFEMKASWFFD